MDIILFHDCIVAISLSTYMQLRVSTSEAQEYIFMSVCFCVFFCEMNESFRYVLPWNLIKPAT